MRHKVCLIEGAQARSLRPDHQIAQAHHGRLRWRRYLLPISTLYCNETGSASVAIPRERNCLNNFFCALFKENDAIDLR